MEIKDIQKVYVVNLNRRPDRWEQIQARWKETGVDLPLTRFVACDGDTFIAPKSWDVGRGAFGCYLSHISILIEMVRLELDNVLVLEDDAVFSSDFRDKLERVLDDCPSIYDQLYLGYQLLHQDRLKPSRITEHLGRGENMNRNHAIIYSRRGAVRILAHLLDLGERGRKQHIDHWLGTAIHERRDKQGQHEYDCFISLPPIVYQGAGVSNINGKNNPENKWLYTGDYVREEPSLVDVVDYKTGYGEIGKGNYMGFENLFVDLNEREKYTILSLHAPSNATIRTKRQLKVMGYMNGSGGSGEPVEVVVDDVVIGEIQKRNSQSKAVTIEPGVHKLEFKVDPRYKGKAHSVWVFGRAS